MVRRFLLNLGVNLAAGFLLFFFSERLFWTAFKPGDSVADLVITWLAYSVLACVLLNILKRWQVRELSRVALAGAVYGWLAEGALVGTLYGTESSAPFPRSIVQTALSWHMLISVVVGWHLLREAVRQGSYGRTALISVGVGFFWAAWAPFQWRETPPVLVSEGSFAVHAACNGLLLAIACGVLSGGAWDRYRPGWFGFGVSILFLGVFYSEQVKKLGIRPLILLPLLVGGVLALLYWTEGSGDSMDRPAFAVSTSRRWKCAAIIMVMPVIASLGYALQIFFKTKGVNPSWIFNGLALAGGVAFVASSAITLKRRLRHDAAL
jgi:hypothetical protein